MLTEHPNAMGSRYVKDLEWEPQLGQHAGTEPLSVPSDLAEPISIVYPNKQGPDTGEECSSVRNTAMFSPPDEREQRWLAFKQSMAASPSMNDTDSNARAASASKVSQEEPIPLNEVLVQGPDPPELTGRLETSAPAIPPPHTPAVDTRMPEPSRRPPEMSVYAPSLLHCQHCCVGAENYQYYYNTVFWALLLALYVIISMAPLFARGVKSQEGLPWSERIRGWKVDGYMISVFVIAFFFFLFTGSLFVVHTYLSGHNLTSIEQRAINSFRAREGWLLRRYYSKHGQGGTLGSGPIAAWRRFRARRQLLRAWNDRWGSVQREGNPWWIASLQEWEYATSSSEAISREADLEKSLGLSYATVPHTGRPASKLDHDTAPLLVEKPTLSSSPFLLNMEQSLGPIWGWFLPIPLRSRAGLHFPLNPRYSDEGLWMPKEAWPSVAQGSMNRA
ncbi:protein S-acyltransferase [Malassezia equina]|uniref:Palmitoyltransferase n=1 Tax=Malassezia equina TaxID=1381935 RepID=A0AAF0EHN1_9BASI|nr:protein S-acyltransferase [Malassezia equina]